MTPKKQRIAIAQACGWEVIADTLCEVHPDKNGEPEVTPVAPLPEYLLDLNAMHEAEKVLTAKQRYEFQVLICRMVGIGFEAICSTAAQRAEALLKTLGLWKDED